MNAFSSPYCVACLTANVEPLTSAIFIKTSPAALPRTLA